MGLESSFNFIDDLVSTNPASGDNPSQGDDHIRGIKNSVQGSFPNLGSAAVNSTAAELNILDGVTKTASEINNAPQLIQGTAQATASGTSKTFSSLPSWVKKITVMLHDVSEDSVTSGLGIGIQLGTSGGIDATNYNSSIAVIQNSATNSISISASRFLVCSPTLSAASFTLSGALTIANVNGNTWVASGNFMNITGDDEMWLASGKCELASTLTQLRLINNVGNFDDGQVNIIYEG